jgi:hypothetical protein
MCKRVTVVVGVLCLVLPVGVLAQGFTQGDWELLLNASGASESDFDNTIFSIAGDLGYFFSPNIEGAIRQGVSFADTEIGGSSLNASTRGALDYHFDLGRWWPFVGANFGYIYGEDVDETWAAGLEGGVKYFVNETTFILGRVEYQWFLDDNDNEGFDNGQWVYVVGIGFRWK